MTVSRPDTSVSQSMGKFTQVTGQFPRFWACGPALAFHPDIAMINSPLITQRPGLRSAFLPLRALSAAVRMGAVESRAALPFQFAGRKS